MKNKNNGKYGNKMNDKNDFKNSKAFKKRLETFLENMKNYKVTDNCEGTLNDFFIEYARTIVSQLPKLEVNVVESNFNKTKDIK